MSEIDPSGRVTIVKGWDLLLPAACLMCGISGADVEQEFLDIKRDLDEYGVIYFCRECGKEIGLASGCVPVREFEAVALANEQLTEENDKYETMLDRLGDGLERDILDYLAKRGISVNTGGNTPDGPEPDGGSADGDNELFVDYLNESDGDSASDDSEPADINPEPTESVTSDGPDDADEPASVNTSLPAPKLEL